MTLKNISYCTLLVVLFIVKAQTADLTVETTDDGYVNLDSPTLSETTYFPNVIRVRSPRAGDLDPTYFFYGFLGWDLPVDRTTWQLSSAILRIYLNAQTVLIATGDLMTVSLCGPTSTWNSASNSQFSWNGMASFRTTYTNLTQTVIPASGYMDFDVTNALNNWLPANPSPARLTLMLTAETYQETQFYSLRATGVKPAPALLFTFTTVPPSVPIAPPTAPVAAPVAPPTDTPMGAPVATPVTGPVAGPIAGPVTQTPESVTPQALTPTTGGVDQPTTPTSGNDVTVGVSVSVVGGAAVAGGVILFVLLKKRNKKKKKKSGADIENPKPTETIYEAVPLSATNSAPNSVVNTAITSSQIKLDKEIGSGNYGKVYIAKFNNAKVAVKYYHQIEAKQDFEHEANLFCRMKPHPHIVQLIGISTDGPQPAIVLEYCNGGSLDKYLAANPLLSDEEKVKLMYGTACGVYHLHTNNIVHRDLAARNILLNRGQPKISDFGMSRFVTSNDKMGQTKTNIGPVKWMAPESIASQSYSPKSDVWMFANVCYEILTNKTPFEDEDIFTVAIGIRDEGMHPTLPPTADPKLVKILEECWRKNPEDRPSMEDVINYFENNFDFVGESESE